MSCNTGKQNKNKPCGCGSYFHLAGRRNFVGFPQVPTNLDRSRVNNWYTETLEYLGLWPNYKTPDQQEKPKRPHPHHNHQHNHHCNCCNKKPNQHHNQHHDQYIFFCINDRCHVDKFIVDECNLRLVSINPYNQEKIYTTQCKCCGLTCASKQIVKSETCGPGHHNHHHQKPMLCELKWKRITEKKHNHHCNCC